jgi:glycerophosphoryl diester phosphodiesterase
MKTIGNTVILLLFMIPLSAQNVFIAHRGASFLAPENTLASVNLAWELGADAVEIDVHLSMDNRVMVIHDKDTKRTCNGKKNLEIRKTPSILLRDQDAGIWKGNEFKGEKIPFLSEVMKTIPEGKKLVIEIKSNTDIIPALKREVQESGKQEQLIFISFDWDVIVQTHETFPNNKCYWLSSSKPNDKKLDEVIAAGLTGINLQYKVIDEDLMNAAKNRNLEVLAWTVDDPAAAKRLTGIGVSAITTNRPKWLKDEINKI